eukprot:277474_1
MTATSDLEHVQLQCSSLPSSWIWYIALFEVIMWRILLLLFSRMSSHFLSLPNERKNKVITYLFAFIIRLGTLIICIHVAMHYIDTNLNMRLDKMNCVMLYATWTAAVFWAASFVIELSVLRSLGWDYWLHHVIVIISVARFVDGSSGAHADVIYAGMIWVLTFGASCFVCHEITMLLYHLFPKNYTIGYYCMLFRVYEQSLIALIIFFGFAFYQYTVNFDHSGIADKAYNLSVIGLNAMVEIYVTSVIYRIMKKKRKQMSVDFVIKENKKAADNSMLPIPKPMCATTAPNISIEISSAMHDDNQTN